VINPSGDGTADHSEVQWPEPPTWDPITTDTIDFEISLLRPFLREKLGEGNILLEDEQLPQKQRFARPRLPPTGKIVIPRKRKESASNGPGGSAKKKKKSNPLKEVRVPSPVAVVREEEGSDVESLFG
jgi:transcriptional activator SPT7